MVGGLTERLGEMGIRTAWLAEADAWTLRKQFSVVLEKTARELRSTSCLEHASRADEPELHDATGAIVGGIRAVARRTPAVPLLLEGKGAMLATIDYR